MDQTELTIQLIRLNITHGRTKQAIAKYNITPVILSTFNDKKDIKKYINYRSREICYNTRTFKSKSSEYRSYEYRQLKEFKRLANIIIEDLPKDIILI